MRSQKEKNFQFTTNATIKMASSATIKTQFFIVSDTHGKSFKPSEKPTQKADVAIHCGDLTDGSKLEEFRTTLQLLKDIDAPLKLIIAGNHDFTIDIPSFNEIIENAYPPLEPELVAKEYVVPGEARQLFQETKDSGIIFLDEGIHNFTLQNGAHLTVYATPYTPSRGNWGFQYLPETGRNFIIENGQVNIAITHGPPRGIMDMTHRNERIGCPDLFAAIA